MPPDETDAATFYNTRRLGAPRVIYNIRDLSEFVDSVMPADQSAPYFEGSTPENYWNGFSEDNFREIAHILYLENAPEYREHLNYIFDYGRGYFTWRDLWDNHRLTMVEIRNIIYNTISNMTVSQAGDMVRIISRALENIVGLNSYCIDFLARWANSLYMVYGDGSVGFPIVEDIYNYEVRVDPVEGDDAVRVAITTPSGTPLEMNLAPPNSMLATLNNRRALTNLARILNVPVPENLSDSEIETFMRHLTSPVVVTDEITTVPLPAGYADSVRRGDYEHSLRPINEVLPAGLEESSRRYASTLGSTGMDTTGGMTASDYGYLTQENSDAFLFRIENEEVALNSQGVCNLNDLANAHAYNKNPKIEFEKIKVPSEQEIWEGLQKNHAGMMETIQYILDDCTIDYKEKDKTKRIDKMEKEMLPRIKGVLTCMDDRLIPEEKRYINLWLGELIQFAIDCNNPVPYRKLAPGIRQWNQKEDPRQKKSHQSLHIIPRLSE
jgi:hypothetical protein